MTGSYIANPIGWGAVVGTGSDYNIISMSTMVSNAGGGHAALNINGAIGNTVSASFIQNMTGHGAYLSGVSPYNTISFSTMINCEGFSTYLLRCKDVTVSQFTECYKQYVDVVKTYANKMPLCDRVQAQQAAIDATGKISSQCLQTLLKCANTSPGGMMDAGVPDATPPDSGGPQQDSGTIDAGPPG